MTMSAKRPTVDRIRERREVPPGVKERVKRFSEISREIKKALADGPLTIPELAGRTGRAADEITYALMTMRKFGSVETYPDDDVDEFYRYMLKE